jgi:hypothetical protein
MEQSLLEKLRVAQLVKKFLPLRKHEIVLPFSLQLTLGSY